MLLLAWNGGVFGASHVGRGVQWPSIKLSVSMGTVTTDIEGEDGHVMPMGQDGCLNAHESPISGNHPHFIGLSVSIEDGCPIH